MSDCPRLRIFAVLALGTLLVLSGCESLSGLGDVIRKPEVRVIGVEIEELTFQGMRMRFDVEIQNPNPVGVQLAGFDYRFEVDGATMVNGNLEERFGLEPRGRSVIPVPVEFTFEQLLAAVSGIADREESDYQITVGLSFQLPVLENVRVSATRDGVLPVIRVPRIAVKGLRVRDLTLQRASLVLGVEVKNPNGFLLTLSSLDYRFGVSGRPWASGKMHQQTAIGRQETTRLSLPMEIRFSDIGQSVRRILAGTRPLSYELQVEMKLGTDLPLLPEATLALDRSGEVSITR
jgi:LEA14-like dessication related protein